MAALVRARLKLSALGCPCRFNKVSRVLTSAATLNRYKAGSAVPKDYDWPSLSARLERRLSVVEELESVVSANIQRATRLGQCILQKAFTGQLT